MYLLDTNVVSELRRTKPHDAVVAWIESVPDASLHISAVTLGEIQRGVELTRANDAARRGTTIHLSFIDLFLSLAEYGKL